MIKTRQRFHLMYILVAALLLVAVWAFGSSNVRAQPGVDVNVSNLAGNESEVSIDVNPTNSNNQVIVGHAPGFATMNTFFTLDGGQTWTLRALGNAQDGLISTFRFDPTVAFDDNGNVYVGYGVKTGPSTGSQRTVVVARSTDGGQTYTQFTQVATTADIDTSSPPNGITNFAGNDKWHLATGPNPVTPAQQDVYIAWTQNVVEAGGLDQRIVVSGSTNGGATFSAPLIINDPSIAGTRVGNLTADPAVGPNGELVVAWEDINAAQVFADVSLDGGTTFGTDNLVTTSGTGFKTSIPPQPDRGVFVGPTIDIDRSGGPFDGRLYVTYTDLGPGGLSDIDVFVRFSNDFGANWSARTLVNDDGGTNSQFLPWLDVDQGTGLVSAVWYDARNDPNNRQVQVFMAVSTDGGINFQPNILVSDGQSDQSTNNPNRTTNNFLEYIGIATRDCVAYPVWSDNSTNLANLDYFTDQVAIQADACEADIELLEINKGQPIDAVECETPHQPANGRAMGLDPGTGLIYYTEIDGFGHNLTQIIEAAFTPSTTCPTISECQVEGAIPGKPFGGVPIPIGTLAHDPGRSAAAGVPVFWGADYTGGGVADIFEIKYTPPVCPAFHLTQVPMPAHPCLAEAFQAPGFTDGMDYDPNTDTLWFSDDASQLVFEQPIGGADPQQGQQVPPGSLKFEVVKCNTGIAFNPLAGEPNPLWLVEYAINMPTLNIEEVYLSQRSGQVFCPVPCGVPPAGTQVFEALAYDSGLHPPDGRNSRAWEDAEFDEVPGLLGDCGVFSNQNATEILPSGNNVGQTVHTIIRWSVPCEGVAQETIKVSEQADIGLTVMYRNNGPLDPVDIEMWKQADAPVDCDVSIHTEDLEEITVAAGVEYFEKLEDGTLLPLGVGPASLVPGPGHTIVARGTPGVDFELDVHLVIPNNPSTASPFGAKLAHHELFDKHCDKLSFHTFEFCVELQPADPVIDPDPTNNSDCVSETVGVIGIEKTLLTGALVCDEPIDCVIETDCTEIGIYQPEPTLCVFEIAYHGPAALIVDTVPAEFECVKLDPSDGTATCSDTSKGKGKSANRIEWDVPAGSNTLIVTIQTVGSPGRGHKDPVFKPTQCGPLPINDGATAFEVDENGNLILDAEGNPIVIVGPSNALQATAVTGTKPCAPDGLTVSNPTVSTLDLDWDDNTDAGLVYNVYRSLSATGPFTRSIATVSVSQYTDTGLDPDTTYCYVVKAEFTATGQEGNESNVACGTTLPLDQDG